MRIITLQPSPVVDHITDDGTELTQLPYPYHVEPDGHVQGQDFWQGSPKWIIGFTGDPGRQAVDMWWDDYIKGDPQRAVGMYLVSRDLIGGVWGHQVAIYQVIVTA